MIKDNDGAETVVLPAPGISVRASSLVQEGTQEIPEFTVYRGKSGEVATKSKSARGEVIYGRAEVIAEFKPLEGKHAHQDAATSGEMSVTAANRCLVYDYSLNVPNPWAIQPVKWYYRTFPFAGFSAVSAGIKAVTDGVSPCGNQNNSAASQYMGTTTTFSSVKAGGGCSVRDSLNVVDAGTPLASDNTLATTCVFATANEILEADMRFNTRFTWHTSSSTLSCVTGRPDLQAVAAHEFGHFFGLAHVPDGTEQMMEPAIQLCNQEPGNTAFQPRTLGAGDLRGMLALYP